MTTIHSIVRESLREAAGLADSLMADDLHDAIATECEAAIRALLTSDAAVGRAEVAYWAKLNELVGRREPLLRVALEAAFKEEG